MRQGKKKKKKEQLERKISRTLVSQNNKDWKNEFEQIFLNPLLVK